MQPVLHSSEFSVSGSVSSLAAGQRPWTNNSFNRWTSSSPNLLSSPTLYNVKQPRITWLSSALSRKQKKICHMG